MPRTDEENLQHRAWASKPRIDARPAAPAPFTSKRVESGWKPVPPDPRTVPGEHCEVLSTIRVEDVNIEVFERYRIKDGSCQCFGMCDCGSERGKRVDREPAYRAVALGRVTKPNGKAYKVCQSVEHALSQYEEARKINPLLR